MCGHTMNTMAAVPEGKAVRGSRAGPRAGAARRGQVLVLFAVLVLVLGAMCVLAIDVGRLFVCKAELQNAVDAASLAGASQLVGTITPEMRAEAISEAKRLAAANSVARKSLTLADSDIQFGHYDSDAYTFVPEAVSGIVDSVQVTGRRTPSAPDGPVDLFFGPIFGWDSANLNNVVAVGTKPRRYVMFVLDRSGSMCFDTEGVHLKSSYADPNDPTLDKSPSGWYWLPYYAYEQTGWGYQYRTAWLYGVDDNTGGFRTDFLPQHIQDHLDANRFFNFRSVDYPTSVISGWVKVPPDVTLHGRYGSPWNNWLAQTYYWVIPSQCGYATSDQPVQPLQDTMDAACAFVDLLRDSDDMAGLVTFASKASTDQVLTTDFVTLKSKLQSFAPSGGTAEPEGMDDANDELVDSGRADGFGQRIMILLTDGQANMYHEHSYDNDTHTFNFLGQSVTCSINPTVAAVMDTQARRAEENHVRIYTVSFGTDSDTTLHQLIAEKTEGASYYAADHAHLTDIFVDIFRRLPPIITQ